MTVERHLEDKIPFVPTCSKTLRSLPIGALDFPHEDSKAGDYIS